MQQLPGGVVASAYCGVERALAAANERLREEWAPYETLWRDDDEASAAAGAEEGDGAEEQEEDDSGGEIARRRRRLDELISVREALRTRAHGGATTMQWRHGPLTLDLREAHASAAHKADARLADARAAFGALLDRRAGELSTAIADARRSVEADAAAAGAGTDDGDGGGGLAPLVAFVVTLRSVGSSTPGGRPRWRRCLRARRSPRSRAPSSSGASAMPSSSFWNGRSE